MDDKKAIDCIFTLIRSSLCISTSDFSFENIDWQSIFTLAKQRGVAALCLDGIQKIEKTNTVYPFNSLTEQCKIQWISTVVQQEKEFIKKQLVLEQLSEFFNANGIKMMLLKGYGCALNYPNPSHRKYMDIDIYLFGNGSKADVLMKDEYDIISKQNEDKHSIFVYNGVMVENHAKIINTAIHPMLSGLECYFEMEAEKASVIEIGKAYCFIPSDNMNALFLSYHTASHFCKDETNIQHLCDWATFILKNGQNVDWNLIEKQTKQFGYFNFICCLNGIVQDYLGVPSSLLPNWNRATELEQQVVNSIVFPRYVGYLSPYVKLKRFFSNQWKFRMVYKENLWLYFLLLAKSYYRTKVDKKAKSIWKNEGAFFVNSK